MLGVSYHFWNDIHTSFFTVNVLLEGPVDLTVLFSKLELFCEYLMPETYDDMVACDECELWYHLKCVKLPKFPAKDQRWICDKCK